MDRRFDARLRDMLAQAEVSAELIDGLISRLEAFVHPFTASLQSATCIASRRSTSCVRSPSRATVVLARRPFSAPAVISRKALMTVL